jgi:hypothetical protein
MSAANTVSENRMYKYWSTDCHECAEPIPVLRYRVNHPDWPEEHRLTCPNCGFVDVYNLKEEVNLEPTLRDERIPLEKLPFPTLMRRS